MTEQNDEVLSKRKNFRCGVVEGFYGRPWTTEQRKDLFFKLNKWGMDTYVYAPKDDYKHRAYWRELYTVEEAEHLTSLISAAKARGIEFCYALSPGLDITYSSQKEITTLKRKLEQVAQFGCTSFALLFDDIEPEMSEADKQIFQSFAHAQVTITNDIYQHLSCPKFLLCPTQYCSTRAVPSVNNSEYLNTLGTKLSQEIDILWTGPKVISKTLTAECIQEITAVLRRPPVIWDNLHANDYDLKRVFLGPYCGRSPELIPLLRGVLTNPNCEYNANHIAIYTLAHWANCSLDAPLELESLSSDIKLEREGEQGVCEEDALPTLSKHVYHHRQALKFAINDWLPEFSIPKDDHGPVTKPQTVISGNVAPVAIIPIVPSLNTCMSLSTSTTVTTTQAIPTVNTSHLQALADVCSTVTTATITPSPVDNFNPVSNPVMNSLVSPTKVVTNESLPNPIIPMANSNMSLPAELPISTLPVPILSLKDMDHSEDSCGTVTSDGDDEKRDNDSLLDGTHESKKNGLMSVDEPTLMSPAHKMDCGGNSDVDGVGTIEKNLLEVDNDVLMDTCSDVGSMQVEVSNSPVSAEMFVESNDVADEDESPALSDDMKVLTSDDLILLCDLFYLPFEHGSRGLRLLHDFNWLKIHAVSLLADKSKNMKPEALEWRRRRCRFSWWCSRVRRLARRVSIAPNKELYRELRPYLWELCHALAPLHAYIAWLELGKFPQNISANTQGSYTWFSRGWRSAFECGLQEPWVFRGGLAADLRRLLPIDAAPELRTSPLVPATPPELPLQPAPYHTRLETEVSLICLHTCNDCEDATSLLPDDLQSLPYDVLVAPFITFTPEFCLVIEDEQVYYPEDDELQEPAAVCTDDKQNGTTKSAITGYICAALNAKDLKSKVDIAWSEDVRKKYPKDNLQRDGLSEFAKELIDKIHNEFTLAPASLLDGHPSVLNVACLPTNDNLAIARTMAVVLAALRANGSFGVHVFLKKSQVNTIQMYTKLGFTELAVDGDTVFYGRTF